MLVTLDIPQPLQPLLTLNFLLCSILWLNAYSQWFSAVHLPDQWFKILHTDSRHLFRVLKFLATHGLKQSLCQIFNAYLIKPCMYMLISCCIYKFRRCVFQGAFLYQIWIQCHYHTETSWDTRTLFYKCPLKQITFSDANGLVALCLKAALTHAKMYMYLLSSTVLCDIYIRLSWWEDGTVQLDFSSRSENAWSPLALVSAASEEFSS